MGRGRATIFASNIQNFPLEGNRDAAQPIDAINKYAITLIVHNKEDEVNRQMGRLAPVEISASW